MKNVTKMIMMLLVLAMAFVIAPQARSQVVLMTESFENGGAIPANWASVIVGGSTNGLSYITSGSTGYPAITVTPYNGSYEVFYNAYSIVSGSTRLYRTVGTSTVGYAQATVDFAMFHDLGYAGTSGEGITPQYSIDGGATWTSVGSVIARNDGSAGWKIHTITLPADAGEKPNVRIAFLFSSQFGNNVFMDFAHLNGIPLGTLQGTVTNSVGGAPIQGATVAVNANPTVTTNAAGFYTVTAVAPGTANVTVSAVGFVNYTGTATITPGATTTKNIAMIPGPKVGGIVTDASNGNPIVGATITVGTGPLATTTLSVAGGVYLTPGLALIGVQPVVIGKTGYNDCLGTVTLVANTTSTQNCGLFPTEVPPGPCTAVANNPDPNIATAVNLNWGIPQGMYQLIYDDGIQDNFAIWSMAKNLNALKFSAVGFPAKLIGGRVNIGTIANYPVDPLPFTKFTMLACKADGPGGVPGTVIDSVEITPAGYGWIDFSFAVPITITTGDFFLVMKQGGTPPHAAGLGVDLTNTQLRSYSRFVTGGAPWVPAAGNFMIRAIMQGMGGPMEADNAPSAPQLITAGPVEGLTYETPVPTVTGYEGVARTEPYEFLTDGPQSPTNGYTYQVWRLKQGEEGNQALWQSLQANLATESYVDNGWASVPAGPYRWAVKAIYAPGQRPSPPTFSNPIGKFWTANVDVCVTLTCAVNPKAGTVVKLINNAYPNQYTYTKTTDTTGCVHFTGVWKGTYTLQANRMTYPQYTQVVTIMGDGSYNIQMLQNTTPVTNLVQNAQSLLATWSPPRGNAVLLDEKFTTGGFATNGWVVSGGSNWQISTGVGNPAPSAMFNWTPSQVNYTQDLTSKAFAGISAPIMHLKYSIFLSNFGAALNSLDVQLWNGTVWTTLKHYTNQGGDIPWTAEEVDISSVTNNPAFKIRFHATGDDSFDINNWNVDNIQIYATDGTVGPNPCVLGYNFYLNGVQLAFTTDTTYTIPSGQVVYGTSYISCVKAVYGSGYSTELCTPPWNGKFLCPPTELAGDPVESSAYLTWTKPNCSGGGGGPTPQWIRWDDGVNYDAIGTGGAVNFDIAARWDAAMLVGLAGGAVTKIAFYPASTGAATYRLRVWQGANAGTMLVDQAIPTVTLDAWNEVTLTTPSSIDITKELWIGVNVNATSGWPAGCDDGPAIDGYGDMMYYQGAWSTLVALAGLSYNWNLAAWIAPGKKSGGQPVILTQGPPIMQTGQFSASGQVNTGSVGATHIGGMNAPLANPTLLGYNIYKDGSTTPVYVAGADVLEYYDNGLAPGTYSYTVTGYYDVAPIAPLHDNSLPAGPVEVVINYGHPLPFFEPWDNGTFGFNNWIANGHWSMNTGIGNPAPCADFTGLPAIGPYEQALTSEFIDASPYTCAKIWLDFDLKLIDRNNTSAEKLIVDIFYAGTWHQKLEVVNNGSTNWVPQHVDISSVKGQSFAIRFTATGDNSIDILHWYVDNINAYAVCASPNPLTYAQTHNTVKLTWTSPACGSGGGGGPTPQWIRWDDGVNNDAIGTGGAADFDIAARWDASMITALDGGAVTKIAFFPASTGSATYKLRVWKGADAGTLLVDQDVPSVTLDEWNEVALTTPSAIDVNDELWIGVNVLATTGWPAGCDAGPQDEGYGNMIYWTGAWTTLTALNATLTFNWNLAAYVEPAKKSASLPVVLTQNHPMNQGGQFGTSGKVNTGIGVTHHTTTGTNSPAASSLAGYNVWRTDVNTASPYLKLNPAPLSDTTYTDVVSLLVNGSYKYFVTSVFNNTLTNAFLCESPGSDTLTVLFPHVGVAEIGTGQISVYPNPATEVLNIKSDYTITNVDVMNFVGQTVYTSNIVASKTAKLNVTTFKAGVYFVKVSTTEGIRTIKITVTH